MRRKSFLRNLFLLTGIGFFKNTTVSAAYSITRRFIVNKVKFIWSGAITGNSVRVNAKLTSATSSARLLVSTNPGLSSPSYGPYAPADASTNFIAKLSIAGLLPGTTYYYAIEADGDIDTAADAVGKFKTSDNGPMSFRFSVASCNEHGNHPVFLKIKEKAPLFHITHGDFHYGNPNSATDINIHRAPFETTLAQPNMKTFLQEVPIVYMWDDHDYCGDNTNGSAAGRTNARLVFQEYVPHFPLVAGAGDVPIYQAFSIGRIRFILSDLRSERGSSIMGATQKAWFKNECLSAKNAGQAIVWISSVPWGGVTDFDTWAGFAAERTELSDYFKDNGIKNLLVICGDAHMIAIDNGNNHDYSTGANNPFKYPVLQAAAVNQVGSFRGGTYSEGFYSNPDVTYGQYAVVDITDTGGGNIGVVMTGYRVTGAGVESVLLSYSFNFSMLSVLAATVTQFSATIFRKTKALLSWELHSGDACQELQIERSGDGISFTQIGRTDCTAIAPNGTSYSYIDPLPLRGKNYYRIKIVNQNGAVAYSLMEVLAFYAEISVTVVSNPVRDKLVLTVESIRNAILDYSIEDAQGRLVLKSRMQVISGTNTIPIQLGDLSAGVYFILFFVEQNRLVNKFVVL